MNTIPSCFPSPTFCRLWLLALLGWFVFTCVNGASDYYYSWDNIMFLRMSSGKNLAEVLQFSKFETHPPLGNILLHYWSMISPSPFFIRCFSLLFGIGLILAHYSIGKISGGVATGLFAATLIALNPVFIVQSFVVRYYTLFLCLCSLSLLFFLRWLTQPRFFSLAMYSLCALTAGLTHFSIFFVVATMAATGTLQLVRRGSPLKPHLWWFAANCLVLGIIFCVYSQWQDAIAWYSRENMYEKSSFLKEPVIYLASYALLLIPIIFGCFLPAYALAFGAIGSCVAFRQKTASPITVLLTLVLIAFCISTTAIITRHYTLYELRRYLWLTVFIIPFAAYLITSGVRWLQEKLASRVKIPVQEVVLVFLLVWSAFSYTPRLRFSDPEEYAIPMDLHKQTTSFLQQLPANTAVLVGRIEAMQLAPETENMYGHLIGNARTGMLAIPLYAAKLIVGTEHAYFHDEKTLQKLMEETKQKGLLNTIENLVLIRSQYLKNSSRITNSLISCEAFRKNITKFTAAPEYSYDYKKSHIQKYFLTMTFDKKYFYNEVLNPQGKAHHCLKDEN